MGQSVLESSVAVDTATIAPLVLGHCNGPRAGEVIQLTRPKSYLGAGNLNTSSPAKPNLAGVHCLILRGRQQTIVRRWSQSARLNGRSFDDAALATGDRLQLGTIELEVLADASADTLTEWRLLLNDRVASRRESREPALKSREAELARRAAGFERNELELQQKTEQTLRLAEELHRRQVLLDLLSGEVCARESEAERRAAANDQLRLELDTQAQALDHASQQHNERRAATELEQANLADILRARTVAWEVQQTAEAAILAARETAVAQAETLLTERDAQFAATPQSDISHSELDQERQNIERDRLQVEQACAELEKARDELNTQREGMRHDQRRQQEFETALNDRATQLDQADAERNRQSEALEHQRVLLASEILQLNEQRAVFEVAQQSAAQAQAEAVAYGDEARRAVHADTVIELERRRSELADLQQQLTDRERQFDKRLAAYSAERAEFATRQEQSDDSQRQLQATQQDLALREVELDQRRQGLEQQLVEHEQRLEQIATKEQHLADRAAELDAIAASQVELLESRRDELARSHTNFAAECSSRQLELEAAHAQLETAQRQHCDATEEFERRHAEFTNRQASIDEQLAELTARAADVTEREHLLAEREQCLHVRESTIGQLPTEASTELELLAVDSAPPESTEAVFRRLGVLSLLRETPEDTSSEESEQQTSDELSPELNTQPDNAESADAVPVDLEPEETMPCTVPIDLDDGDEDQVIERYMSQLLSRIRGGKDDTAPSATFVKPAKKSNPAVPDSLPARIDAPNVATETEVAVAASPEPPASAAPRHPRPSSSDIAAMRDLANQSAQAAIDAHTRKMLLNDLYVKSIICLTGIVSGIVLLSWAPRIGWIGLLAGAACFLGSAVWGVQLGLLFREFLKASGVASLDDGETDTDATVIASAHHQPTEPSDEAN